ncbi:coatomer subunit delta [Trichomonascus vanleenenianus]|uniref:coatomer subunit delta n=1 Tax=Trichomonascus vanleenenianus TaxID=2268995 RepID=UPI003ECA7AC7
MVVLAASICTRGGKAILSRQFRDLHKDRVQALLASFPKLAQRGSQHTTAEDENVRYVYQPLEELYVVLITNRQSNILQDIETLRLMTSVVSSIVRNVDEREVLHKAFELLSAFDEIVTLGYRENLNLQQVETFLAMESHEEKIQEIIERNKQLEADNERRKRAKELDLARRQANRRGNAGSGFGSPSMGGMGRSFTPTTPVAAPMVPETTTYDYDEPPKPRSHAPKGKGLQLGKKKTGGLDALRSEVGEASPLMSAPAPRAAQAPPRAAPAAPTVEGIEVSVVEQLSITLSRDGSVKSSDVKGNLQLHVGDPSLARIKLLSNVKGPDSLYKTHPNVDKAEFGRSRAIGLKDASRPFPATQVSVLRWKLHGDADNDTYVPILFSCWLNRTDKSFFEVTIEYELNSKFTEPLKDVRVHIPLPTNNAHVTDPTLLWEQYDEHIVWTIPEVQPGGDSTGSFSFTAEADLEEEFFPMQVAFEVTDALSTFGGVDVEDVVSAGDGEESMPFKKTVSIVTEKYIIEA